MAGDRAAIMTAATEGRETSTIIAMGSGVLDRLARGAWRRLDKVLRPAKGRVVIYPREAV